MHAIRKYADRFKENTQQQIPSLEKVEPKTKKEKKKKNNERVKIINWQKAFQQNEFV